MLLPAARGVLSSHLIRRMTAGKPLSVPVVDGPADPLTDEDLQIALWTAYELHYHGFDGVDPRAEWDAQIIAFRARLEDVLLDALRRDVLVPPSGETIPRRLRALVEDDDGPSVARFVQNRATMAQFDEFAVHRSVYQLKEADPHSWAIPRLAGRAKAALLEIQIDEYGDGDPSRMHSELFGGLLRSRGLDDRYGAYIEAVPAVTLAVSNVMSLFGLRRDLRGALVGHLAAYEMTSSGPCRRYGKGLRRLGGTDEDCAFFDVHVTADALHEQLAAHDLCGALAADEPGLTEDIAFGAAACLYVDRRFAEYVLPRWTGGRSTLRSAVADGRLAG